MNPVVGPEAQEDFASEAVATVTQLEPAPAPAPALSPEPVPVPHGICVNCGRVVRLRVVSTDGSRRTYQWVPDGDPARPGRHCNEGSLPAFHWAADATAAVYDIAT